MDAVVGMGGGDDLSHRRLGLAVGPGHRAVVGLVLDGEALTEVAPGHRTRGIHQTAGEAEVSVGAARGGLGHVWAGRAGTEGAGRRSRFIGRAVPGRRRARSEEHTSELQSLMRISYAVFCLKKKNEYITTSQ